MVGFLAAKTTADAFTRGKLLACSSAATCSAMSPPAEKARSPAPVMTMAPTSASSSSSCKARSSWLRSSELSAFNFSGLFSVTSPTGPRRSTRIGPTASDHPLTAKTSDVVVGVAELGQDVVGVLTVLGRWRADARLGPLHVHARSEQPLVPQQWVIDLGDYRQRLYLLIRKALLDIQHRPSRHLKFRQSRHPLCGGSRRKPLLDLDRQLWAMLEPLSSVDEPRILDQLRRLQRLAQASEHDLAAGLDDQAAIAGPVDAGRLGDRMVVARLAGNFARHQVASRLELHQA